MSSPVSKREHFSRLNVYPNDPVVGERWEINEEIYWYFLEILPPLAYTGKGFYMSEFYTRNITTHYFIENGKYFCEWVTYPNKENK